MISTLATPHIVITRFNRVIQGYSVSGFMKRNNSGLPAFAGNDSWGWAFSYEKLLGRR
jgi:hypothetical protein